MRYLTRTVDKFLNFIQEKEGGDPLNPLSITITVKQANEIVDYFNESLLIKNKEVQELKDTIIKMEISKLKDNK